ncbi:DUF2945 domain-containing protein [Pseudooceanicola sp. LIPI14-2-Ac024]|uniref:DUF2945 domain-containing protein n=1 Tax=Pseudooceanicola sp. LIPI14-2-Ac024 TaxID=3344875 RepID=UPI0035CEA94D
MRQNVQVQWPWGQGTATGRVRFSYDHKITRTLQGAEITRDGSEADPALLIEQENGHRVLKLASEVERV